MRKTSGSFTVELCKTLAKNMHNDYKDNIDTHRYRKVIPEQEKFSFKGMVKNVLKKRGFQQVLPNVHNLERALNAYDKRISYFEACYDLLNDDYSRDLLVQVCAYRILGHTKVKLPMNNPEFWNSVERIHAKQVDKENGLETDVASRKVFRYELSEFGYPVTAYLNPLAIYYDFIYKGYFYEQGPVKVLVEPGDHVIDAGACFGDTALFFAHHAGPSGKVYSFEFVPSNISIFSRNMELNPELAKRINLLRHPLWSEVDQPVYFESKGSGTRVSQERISEHSQVVKTATIDDMVKNGVIEKVDFIKMDIEGAEVEALKSTVETIRRFRPKLALCLYHRESDFQTIPQFINSLNLGYRFYFNHYTMHEGESVLFCEPSSR